MSEPFFDTNIIVDWLFDRPPAIAELARYAGHRLSRIAWAEVLAGEPAATRRSMQTLLLPFQIVEVDQQVAQMAADIRHQTRMRMLDALVLATARVHNGILVTRNTKDFRATMPGIRIPYTL